jgi:hypothetical protein
MLKYIKKKIYNKILLLMKIKCDIIPKNESLYKLIEYFKSIEGDNIYYYINTNSKDIISFLESNIYDKDDIELFNMVRNHLKIAFRTFSNLVNNIFKIDLNESIKISFITDLIYYEDIFVIKDVIYINYSYIKRVFFNLEENKYSSMNEVCIHNNNIYDNELIKLLFKNLIFLSQNKNKDLWISHIIKDNNLSCFISDIDNFIIDYDIIKNPSTSFTNDKIFIFNINNKNYCSLNVIVSNKSYSPYYDNKIYEINKNNNNKYELKEVEEKYNIPSNLFEEIATGIINSVLTINC